MENAIPVQEPVAASLTAASAEESKSSSKPGLFLLIAFLVILVLGLGGTVVYLLFFKETDTDGDTGGDDNGGPVTETCVYNGSTYDEGEEFSATDGCNTCTCTNGEVVCTLMVCEEEPTEGTVEMSFDGPTGTYYYTITFKVPEGDFVVNTPSEGEYPSSSHVVGDTYIIRITHPYTSGYLQYSSVDRRDIQNLNHELGDVYFTPIDLSVWADNALPPVSWSTHVGYAAVNEVSLEEPCGDEMTGLFDPPCGLPGLLGDWSSDDSASPFLLFTCFFEKGEENLALCDRAVETLNVVQTQY